MTKAEKARLLEDKWPKFSKKNKSDFLEFLDKASKARIFDVEDCDCIGCKRVHSC